MPCQSDKRSARTALLLLRMSMFRGGLSLENCARGLYSLINRGFQLCFPRRLGVSWLAGRSARPIPGIIRPVFSCQEVAPDSLGGEEREGVYVSRRRGDGQGT